MVKTITQDEFTKHFESIFFSDEAQRVDVEFVAQKHKAEQETEKVKMESDKWFQGRNRKFATVSELKGKGLWSDNFWLENWKK